jgi:poly(A) polymerase
MVFAATHPFDGVPEKLFNALAGISRKNSLPVFITGGTVRDWLLGRQALDIDITVPRGARLFIEQLRQQLGGAIVPLDTVEEVYRLVCREVSIDCAVFREGTTTIEDDLLKRDFTINALAVPLDHVTRFVAGPEKVVLDPSDGINDLHNGRIRCTSADVFTNDPLRLLRAFRFSATLGYTIDSGTLDVIQQRCADISSVSVERISYELEHIVLSRRSGAIFSAMFKSGILGVLFPEMLAGVGMAQPSSHHLDVFDHNLAALAAMDGLIVHPEQYFPDSAEPIEQYLGRKKRALWLKWASFYHDIGKPLTHAIREDKGGRITFYNHDRAGAELFYSIAARYKWSRENTRETGRLIENHMWPFHLNNARKKTGITRKACLRLVKAMEDELPGLFMLAMADSLASQGENRPPDMEKELAGLFSEVEQVRKENIETVLKGPRLISGRDLIDMFKLEPGPFFRTILDELEKVRVEGVVSSRAEAFAWIEQFILQYKQSSSKPNNS